VSEQRKSGGCGCAAVGAVVAVIVWLAWPDPDSSRISGNAVSQLPTRAEWTQKVAAGPNGQLVQFGNLLVGRDDLYRAVGPPSNTEMIGTDVYLYWQCADGTVQVVAPRSAFEVQGVVTGRINTY